MGKASIGEVNAQSYVSIDIVFDYFCQNIKLFRT